MPLSEKARVEVYLPDLPKPAYQNLLDTLDQEFTFAIGGATTVCGLEGSYLSRLGVRLQDRINLSRVYRASWLSIHGIDRVPSQRCGPWKTWCFNWSPAPRPVKAHRENSTCG